MHSARDRRVQFSKPAVGHIDLNLLHEPALGANTKQVADQQHLEPCHVIERWSTVVTAVQVFGLGLDEAEVNVSVNQTQQVVLRNQLIDRDLLQFPLLGMRWLKHPKVETQSPRLAGTLSAV